MYSWISLPTLLPSYWQRATDQLITWSTNHLINWSPDQLISWSTVEYNYPTVKLLTDIYWSTDHLIYCWISLLYYQATDQLITRCRLRLVPSSVGDSGWSRCLLLSYLPNAPWLVRNNYGCSRDDKKRLLSVYSTMFGFVIICVIITSSRCRLRWAGPISRLYMTSKVIYKR